MAQLKTYVGFHGGSLRQVFYNSRYYVKWYFYEGSTSAVDVSLTYEGFYEGFYS